MESLYNKLESYQEKGIYPFHMPGHKRNEAMFKMPNAYAMDITEIDGFDNLADPKEIIKESQDRAKQLYGAKNTHYLVNGSTVGILAAIAACTNKGNRIVVARNCHKAVYHALILNELKPVYIYPQYEKEFGIHGGILPEKLEELFITYDDIKAVILTSPTYEGVVTDIKAVAEIVHKRGVPLIVDEAHGAHLGFHSYFPKSAVTCGADLVIQSVHKTMPCFTQTALLHHNSELVKDSVLVDYINMYQTSSPSYLFMSGIDRMVTLMEQEKDSLFDSYVTLLKSFYNDCKQLTHIKVMTKQHMKSFGLDPSKLIISVAETNMTGKQLYETLLHTYGLQMEMVSKDYVIAMTSIGDTKEGLTRLRDALIELDQIVSAMKKDNIHYAMIEPNIKYFPYEAFKKDSEEVKLVDSVGFISSSFVYLYPPGIPMIVPGEIITESMLTAMLEYQKKGLSLNGLKGSSEEKIQVVLER